MKPQPAQAVAVFLLANQNRSAQAPTNVTIRFAELGLPPGVAMEVEDVSTGEKHAKLYTGELVTDVSEVTTADSTCSALHTGTCNGC